MPSRQVMLITSGALAILGGIMMLLSGFATHSFFLSVLSFVEATFGSHLPDIIRVIAVVTLNVLGILISLGGIMVIAGGLMLLLGRSSIGRVMIALGGGAGLLSLVIGLAYYLFVSGLSNTILHLEYWIGVALAATARWLSGRPGRE